MQVQEEEKQKKLVLGVIWCPQEKGLFVRVIGTITQLEEVTHVNLHLDDYFSTGIRRAETSSIIRIDMRFSNIKTLDMDNKEKIQSVIHYISLGDMYWSHEKSISLRRENNDVIPVDSDIMPIGVMETSYSYTRGLAKLTNYIVRAVTHVVAPTFFLKMLLQPCTIEVSGPPVKPLLASTSSAT